MTRWLGPVLALTFASAAAAAPVKVTVVPNDAKLWTEEELSFVRKAAEVTFERIRSYEVAQCAYRNTTRGAHTKDQLRAIWGRQIPVLNKNPNVTIRIYKEDMPKAYFGKARVGIAEVDRANFRIDNLAIALNQEHLNRYAAKYATGNAAEDAVRMWVHVMAHEIAHNLGHSHGSSGDWSTDYPGYFVTELGFCTMTEGKHGSKG